MVYIKVQDNIVANTPSHLPTQNSDAREVMSINELFLEQRLFEVQVAFPLDLAKIKELQYDNDQFTRMLSNRQDILKGEA